MLSHNFTSVGPMTRAAADELLEELQKSRRETKRYREVVDELRQLLATLDNPGLMEDDV